MPGFRAGEVDEDGIGFGVGYARVGDAPEQESARVNLSGVVLGFEAIGPKIVLHAAPEPQQVGHREAGDVHRSEAVIGGLAHVAVGAFENIGGGMHTWLGLGP